MHILCPKLCWHNSPRPTNLSRTFFSPSHSCCHCFQSFSLSCRYFSHFLFLYHQGRPFADAAVDDGDVVVVVDVVVDVVDVGVVVVVDAVVDVAADEDSAVAADVVVVVVVVALSFGTVAGGSSPFRDLSPPSETLAPPCLSPSLLGHHLEK